MRRQKSSGAIHSSLHFIEYEKRARPPAQLLCLPQVGGRGHMNATLRLKGLDDKRGMPFARKGAF